MANLSGVVQQLKKAHAEAQREVNRLGAALAALGNLTGRSATRKLRTLSAAARRKISLAQLKRAHAEAQGEVKRRSPGRHRRNTEINCGNRPDAKIFRPISRSTSALIRIPAFYSSESTWR
jgi:hypothetical protein